MLDSTVGLLLIYALLKAVAWLVNRYNITPLRSGEYGACDHVCVCHVYCVMVYVFACHAGEPFRLHYWLAQLSVYMIVMLVMKLIVGPLVAFNFWKEVHLPQPIYALGYCMTLSSVVISLSPFPP